MFVASSLCSSKKKKKMTTACLCSTWLARVVRFGAGGSTSKMAYLCGLQISACGVCQMVLRAEGNSSFPCCPLHSLYSKWPGSKSNGLKRTSRKWMAILWLTLGNYITLFSPYSIGGGSHKGLLRSSRRNIILTTQNGFNISF